MRDEPLRVAVIGLGSMGRNHLRVYGEMDSASVVAVADADEAALAQAAQGHNLHPYEDYRRLLEEVRLDAVSIATPTRLHREVALTAIEAGVNVLIEKPIASTVEEGLEIWEAAQRAGVKVAVGHVERFNPAVTELRRRLEENTLGRLYQVQARRVGPFQQRVRDVGVVHDLATHDIGVMRFVLGAEVTRLYAQTRRGIHTEFEDTLFAVFQFDNGVSALLDVNWLSPFKVRELLLVGERGMLSLDYISQGLFYHQGATPAAPLAPAEMTPERAVKLDVLKMEPLRGELEAFMGAVALNEEPPVGCADAIVALHLAEKLVQSAMTGQAIEVASPLARSEE